MTASILRHTSHRSTLRQRNNAGGQTHVVDAWTRLNRFLTIGVQGGTYYVDEKTHVLDNVAVVDECLALDYKRTIDTIVEVSEAGRAPKNDYAIYALARAAASDNKDAAAYALKHLSKVCRIGTHLFQFVAAVDGMRGWGPALRKAISKWYLDKPADQLAQQVLKYQQREGWSHRDVLRKAHPKTYDPAVDAVLQYAVKGTRDLLHTPDIINTVEQVRVAGDPTETAYAIRHRGLTREMIPTEHMNAYTVQAALADTMPYTALMRNLGNLSKAGVLDDPDTVQKVYYKLTDANYIHKSRVHPFNILTAHRTYGQGHGFRGSSTWNVNPAIDAALEAAFYEAFKNVEPTGKRFLVGMDVSGSMSMGVADGILTHAEIAGALALMLKRTEPWVEVMAFANRFIPLDLRKNEKLDTFLARTRRMNFGSTDCAQPMIYAMQQGLPVDVFVVITDNETWAGRTNPDEALRQYRKQTGIDAKLIVLATAATQFSIADPNDPGMLDISGFDSSVPEVIRLFVNGQL